MGTTLDHGIYLPDEGERNCYDGLAGNWVALDNHLGNTDIHVTINDKQAWNGHVADTTIHVTSADKQAWNGHVADTTIHVTAEDKAKWDAVTDKANDSDVVHKSGNETVGGNKNFTGLTTTAPNVSLWPINSRTTDDITLLHSSAVHVEQRDSGNLTDLSNGAWNIANLGYACFFFRNNQGTDIRYKHLALGTINRIHVVSNGNRQLNNVTPDTDNTYSLGDSTRRWATINGLEPSSLGMPDLSNGIDISSYITNLAGSPNIYSPPANGYIILRSTTANVLGIVENTTGMGSYSRGSNQLLAVYLPVVKNGSISIYAICSSLTQAKFIPCLGNI